MAVKVPGYDAADWTVTLGGIAVPWQRIECTLEQFHVPAQFSITAPFQSGDIARLTPDTPSEVIIQHKKKDFFVGIVDQSGVAADEEIPEGEMTFNGRDLSAKLVHQKLTETPPMNHTASQIVKDYCRGIGLTDMSQITDTTESVGVFIEKNYHVVTKGMNKHSFLFDLAEFEHFVFRIRNRVPYFGPQPPPVKQITLNYQQQFNYFKWHKNHTNADAKVRVMSWNGKKKTKIVAEEGTGSLVITKIVPGLTQPMARKMAVRMIEQVERFLVTMDITGMAGSTPLPASGGSVDLLEDVLYSFEILKVGVGISQIYNPARIHHILTQDDHLMDLHLYNSARITA